jgi:hypothetical protein
MKKKLLFSAMLVCLLALGFTGCGDKDNGDPSSPNNGSNKIPITIKLTPIDTNKYTISITGTTWRTDQTYFSFYFLGQDYYTITGNLTSLYSEASFARLRTTDTEMDIELSRRGSYGSRTGTIRLSLREGDTGLSFLANCTNFSGNVNDYILVIAEDSGLVNYDFP